MIHVMQCFLTHFNSFEMIFISTAMIFMLSKFSDENDKKPLTHIKTNWRIKKIFWYRVNSVNGQIYGWQIYSEIDSINSNKYQQHRIPFAPFHVLIQSFNI